MATFTKEAQLRTCQEAQHKLLQAMLTANKRLALSIAFNVVAGVIVFAAGIICGVQT